VKDAEKDPESEIYRKPADAAGKQSYPVDLYLLGALRMFGRNTTTDCIKEVTTISAERMCA
jgi:hypothetical protein